MGGAEFPSVSPATEMDSALCDPPEQPVRLIVRAGGEEQRVGRSVVHEHHARTGAPTDRRSGSTCDSLPSGSDALVRPVGLRGVGVDLAVTEVSDEEIAAEPAEVARGERQAPRGIELPAGCDPAQKHAVGVEPIDEAEALALDIVLRSRVLLRVADEDLASDLLDTERREPGWDPRIDEPARQRHVAEAAVEDVDPAVVEVRRVQAGRRQSRAPCRSRPPRRSATTCACVPRDEFQARILPSSVEKMKRAEALPTTKPEPPLPTSPVGAFSTATTSGVGAGGGGNGVPSAA